MGFLDRISINLGSYSHVVGGMAVSFWIAWVLLLYSALYFPNAADPLQYDTFCYLISTITVSVFFFLCGALSSKVRTLLLKSPFVLAAGFAASVGTAIVVFASGVNSVAVLVVGNILTGSGTAIIGQRCAMLASDTSARNFALGAAGALLQAYLLYLCAKSMPLVVGMVFLIILPLSASFMAVLVHPVNEAAQDVQDEGFPPGLIKLTVASCLMGFAFSVARGMYPSGLNITEFNDSTNYVALVSMASCLGMIAIGCLAPRGFDAGKVSYWIIVVVVMVATIFPFLGIGHTLAGMVSSVANSIIGMTTWIFLGSLCALSRLSTLRIFGFGFSAYMGGSAIAWPLSALISAKDSSMDGQFVGLIILIVVIITVLLLFRQEVILELMHSTDDEQETLHNENERSQIEISESSYADIASDCDKNTMCAFATQRKEGSNIPEVALEEIPDNKVVDDFSKLPSWRQRMSRLGREKGLTLREIDVFLLMGKGMNSRSVADALGISYNTSRVHVRNVYTKMGVHSRAELLELVAEEDRRLKRE